MKHLFNFLVIIIIWTTSTIAQRQNYNPDLYKDISVEALRIIDDSSININQDSGAVLLFREVKMVVNKDRSQKITFHIIGKIFDEQAKSDYSQIPVMFNSYYEDISLDFAKTINEDKSFIEVSKDAVQIKTYPDYFGYSSYTDKKILAFSLPALDIGKLFEYQITINKKIPVIDDHWYQSIYFNLSLWSLSDPYFIRIDPVKTFRFILSAPEEETFQFELNNIEAAENRIVKEGREIYSWEVNDLPSVTYEPGMPYLYEFVPHITLSSVSDWRDFGKWAYKNLISKIIVTEQILSKAKELTTNVNSDFEKIKALYDYVREEIDYVQADLDRGGITPHFANEVLRTKYGDCKDQVILLLTLLKSLEIEALPALIGTYSFREHPNYLPTQYFDHLIIFVRSDTTNIWLDTTTELIEFPNLHWANQNRFALVLDQQGGEFIKTTLSESEDNLANFDFDIWPDNDSLKGRIVMQSCGAFEDNISSILGYYPKNNQDELIREIVESYYAQTVAVNKIDINQREAKDDLYYQTININYLESIKDLWQFKFTSNMPLAILYYMIDLPFYDNRKYDYRFPYRFTLKGREVFHSPWENASIRNLPENDSIISNHFDFHQKFKKYKDSIEVNWKFTLKNELVLSEEFESFGENLELWENMILWEIDFVKHLDLTKDNLQEISQSVLAESDKAPSSSTIKFIPPFYVNTSDINPNVIESIQNVMNEYADALNKQDIDRMKNTICKDSPEYENIIEPMKEIFNENEVFFIIDDIRVIDLLSEYAVATYTTLIEFKDYLEPESIRIDILAVFSKCDGEWKILRSFSYDEINNCILYEGFGEMYYDTNEYDKAIVAYKLAIANDSSCTSAYGNLGWTYYLKGNYQNCIEYSEKAVKLDSTALYAHYNIALSYLCLEQFERSKTLYSEIVKYNQDLGREISKGAIIDLKDLIEKNFRKDEAETILNEIFNQKIIISRPAKKVQQNLAEADSLINNGLYQDAAELLEEFILSDPENQEAHYLLGQAYNRLHCPDGSMLDSTNIYFAFKASDHFKKVIEISPYYRGKSYLLDPYSKLTSMWGTMACTYACRGDLDSARWALKYGQQQGGFYPEFLEYNKNVMTTCAQNAILFTNGDNDTFPVWFLQMVENYRKDITVINLSLLNTEWYIKQLKSNDPYGVGVVNIRLTETQIAQLKPLQWEPRSISINTPVPKQGDYTEVYDKYSISDSSAIKKGYITWMMNNTLTFGEVKAVRIQDLMVKEIIEANNWERPIYFASTCSDDNKIGLGDYLKLEGMAYRLVPEKRKPDKEFINEKVVRDNLDNYTFDWLYNNNYKYLEDFKKVANNYRNLFMRLAIHYHNNEQNELAIKTLDEMKSKVPCELIPMKLGFLFEVANLYHLCGEKEKYKEISLDVEKRALEEIGLNPNDVSSYYNPYRILTEIYEKSERFDEILTIWQKLEVMFPDDPTVKANIEKYKKLSSGN